MNYKKICESLIKRIRIKEQDYDVLWDEWNRLDSIHRVSTETKLEKAEDERDYWHEMYLNTLPREEKDKSDPF